MEKLKACPFCGGEAMIKHTPLVGSIQMSYVECKDCDASTTKFAISAEYAADEKAAEAWNRRAKNGSAD